MISPASYMLNSEASPYIATAALAFSGITYAVLEIRIAKHIYEMREIFVKTLGNKRISDQRRKYKCETEMLFLEEIVCDGELPLSSAYGSFMLRRMSKQLGALC